MLTEQQKEQFIPELEKIVKQGLKRQKVLDALQEEKNVFPSLTGKLSEQGIDLDYQNLWIEDRFGHSSQNGVHTFSNLWWGTPYRAKRNGSIDAGKHDPSQKFWGAISKLEVKVTYDEDTGIPNLTLLNNFESTIAVGRR